MQNSVTGDPLSDEPETILSPDGTVLESHLHRNTENVKAGAEVVVSLIPKRGMRVQTAFEGSKNLTLNGGFYGIGAERGAAWYQQQQLAYKREQDALQAQYKKEQDERQARYQREQAEREDRRERDAREEERRKRQEERDHEIRQRELALRERQMEFEFARLRAGQSRQMSGGHTSSTGSSHNPQPGFVFDPTALQYGQSSAQGTSARYSQTYVPRPAAPLHTQSEPQALTFPEPQFTQHPNLDRAQTDSAVRGTQPFTDGNGWRQQNLPSPPSTPSQAPEELN